MKDFTKYKRHIVSLSTIIGFVIFAVGSAPAYSSEKVVCGDPKNVIRESIPISHISNTIRVRVIDKLTGNPIPNLPIFIDHSIYFIDETMNNECPEEANVNVEPSYANNKFTTNGSGIAEKDVIWSAADKKDALVGFITYVEGTSKYSSSDIMIRMDQSQSLATYTLELLDMNLL